jgi:hypothetical protein
VHRDEHLARRGIRDALKPTRNARQLDKEFAVATSGQSRKRLSPRARGSAVMMFACSVRGIAIAGSHLPHFVEAIEVKLVLPFWFRFFSRSISVRAHARILDL